MPPLDEHDVALIRADNPGPFTLSGTNTWVVGRDPCWVVDPGPALDRHLAAIEAEAGARGGARGIVLTHDHADHAESAQEMASRLGVRVAATRAARATVRITDGDEAGPFRVIATPGHAPDHVALVAGPVCFTGDAILGEGSVFIAPDPGALSGLPGGAGAPAGDGPGVAVPGPRAGGRGPARPRSASTSRTAATASGA